MPIHKKAPPIPGRWRCVRRGCRKRVRLGPAAFNHRDYDLCPHCHNRTLRPIAEAVCNCDATHYPHRSGSVFDYRPEGPLVKCCGSNIIGKTVKQ